MYSSDQSYAYCERVAKTRAQNFYFSFLTLPPDRKAAMCAVYAFFRYSDDVSDGDGSDKAAAMAAWRAALEAALSGDYGDSPILPAFHDAVKRYSIPPDYFRDLIEGTEMDLVTTRYQTFEELQRYCYLVASVVGFVCLHIWGFDPAGGDALRYGEACGQAFQLTNILRDIREDAGRDRIYVPQEDLKRFGVSEESLTSGAMDDNFRRLMRHECERAKGFYSEASHLAPLIHAESRATYEIMYRIYRGILESIERNDYDIHSRRARVSTPRKLGIVAQAWLGSRFAR